MKELRILEEQLRVVMNEWHAQPFAFFEADIQALLYARVRDALGKAFTYRHRVWSHPAWAAPQDLGRVSCEAQLRSQTGDTRPDLVVWEASPEGEDCLERRALAIIEIKCSLPFNGGYTESVWTPLLADFEKVQAIVNAGAAGRGLAVMFVALPREGPAQSPPVEIAQQGRCLAVRVVSTAPVPSFSLV